jgi:hypothetical protein
VASINPVVSRERMRRMPARLSCIGHGGRGFADEAQLRYNKAAPRKALQAAIRDITNLRAIGFVAGDAGKEKILSVIPLPPSSSASDPLELTRTPPRGVGQIPALVSSLWLRFFRVSKSIVLFFWIRS